MKNLEKQQKCTMYEDQCTTNGNTGSLDFANATAFASLKMTNNNCHAELVEASRRSRSSVSRAAFTLVELVITIAIVIILSVVSVPIYRSYTDKAKLSEAYALIGLAITAEKAYFSEYGHFINATDTGGVTSYCPVLGIDARGNKYVTLFRIGHGEGVEKYATFCDARLPDDLWHGNYRWLGMWYNITSGSTFNYSNSEGQSV